MESDPRHPSDPPSRDEDRGVRDALSGFNAEEILDDPDEQKPETKHEPAATPDSPNPI
jgi:hypothetical protein